MSSSSCSSRWSIRSILPFLIVLTLFSSVFSLLPSDENSTLPIPPSHSTVAVSTISELETAINNLVSHTTILIAPGSYDLSATSVGQLVTSFGTDIDDVAIRGASGDPDDVVLFGAGPIDNSVEFGLNIGRTTNLLVAYLTIRDVYYHAVTTSSRTNHLTIRRVVIRDTGEQPIKINPTKAGSGIRCQVLVEYCDIGYTSKVPTHPIACGGSPCCYTNGISAHYVSNLVVRHSIFRGFDCQDASESVCGPAVLIWNESEDSIIESNLFLNCARGVYLGMSSGDHSGIGIIRNNVFIRSDSWLNEADVAFYSASPSSIIAHNTYCLLSIFVAWILSPTPSMDLSQI